MLIRKPRLLPRFCSEKDPSAARLMVEGIRWMMMKRERIMAPCGYFQSRNINPEAKNCFHGFVLGKTSLLPD